MALIQLRNLLHESVPYTRLRETEVAGTQSLRVQNTAGLTNQWGIQIGEVGDEQTEVVIGTNSAGTTITCATTAYDHPKDTPIYFIKYNQVVFERSTDGTLGTAAPMTNGTIGYQADGFFTSFDDTSGSASYGYRTYFRNSVLAVNSLESDWITFAGFDFYSLGRIRDRIRRKLWNSSYLLDQDIDDWINECKDKMANKVIQTNEDYAMGTVNVGFGTNGLGTITTADFTVPRRILVTYDGVTKQPSTKLNIRDIWPDQTFSSVNPYHAWIENNVFIVNPTNSGGTAEIVFQRFGTTMVNDTDILPIPMRSYTDIFTEYCRGQALYKDGKTQEGESCMNRAEVLMQDFKAGISPRDETGPTFVPVVEPISTDDY